MADPVTSAASDQTGAGGILKGVADIIGSSSKSKSAPPFLEQYGMGLLGSLFFPQFAQAFSSYKPQEYQQLFGQPGQKLSKSKGKVADAGGMGASGFADDPNSPFGINGSIGQYRRYVNQYQPYAYLASNPFGRPGGPSQAEQDLINNSYFGLTPILDQSKSQAAADSLAGLLPNFLPQNYAAQVGQMRTPQYNTTATPPVVAPPRTQLTAPVAPMQFQSTAANNPLVALQGLTNIGRR